MNRNERGIVMEINNLEKLGDEYIEKKDYNNAIKVYTKIIDYKNDEARFYVKRGNLYCELADICKNQSGEIWRNQERYNNAIKDYTKAIILDGKKKEYYLLRANVYTNIFEEDMLALKDYLNAYEIDNNDDNLCSTIGDMYWLLDDSKTALKYYKLAISINFRNESALYSIASIYDLNNRNDEAVKYYTEFIKYNNTNNIDVFCDRANCLYKLKRYSDALDDLENFLKYNGDNTERSHELRRKIFKKIGKQEKGFVEYKSENDIIENESDEKNKYNVTEDVVNCNKKVIDDNASYETRVRKISEFEDVIVSKLPDDYKNFIINNNSELEYINFQTRDGFIESSVSGIFPIVDGCSKSLYEEYNMYKNKIPKTLIAIAIDPVENPICICVKGKNTGKVYYWLSEFEVDNFKPSYKNMHLIADTFQEFINNLA